MLGNSKLRLAHLQTLDEFGRLTREGLRPLRDSATVHFDEDDGGEEG